MKAHLELNNCYKLGVVGDIGGISGRMAAQCQRSHKREHMDVFEMTSFRKGHLRRSMKSTSLSMWWCTHSQPAYAEPHQEHSPTRSRASHEFGTLQSTPRPSLQGEHLWPPLWRGPHSIEMCRLITAGAGLPPTLVKPGLQRNTLPLSSNKQREKKKQVFSKSRK